MMTATRVAATGRTYGLAKNARICIVGAGAAGLSAAWYLRQRGYSHVTILEKSHQPGGKCRSVVVDGVPIELGAALVMPDYRRVLAVAAAVAVTPAVA